MNALKLNREEFDLFEEFIYRESGIRFNLVNECVLQSHIFSSMKEKGIDEVYDYYKLVSSDKDCFEEFFENITISLTNFFRTESDFQILQEYVLPNILKQKKNGEQIKIWCAGCSTGEEAYSIAITCLETENIKKENIRIFATDLSFNSVIIAKEGKYDIEKMENVPKKYLKKYFDKLPDDKYLVKSDIRNLITFDCHNLIHKFPQYNIDVIFCRNVLIYFDNESVKLTVNHFYDILNRNGFLFIGHTESLFGLDTKFKFANLNNSIIYTKQ
ncbi:CheR family methyltransferase [Brachyspira catarrhinii]|uniref:protein-glutamate O-methyltransferase n=1 Tax=Brachyspira catarrhinii TaxID=2528966 RepID=A0ABY2TQ85_9SPIR|nr:protein-glutamate O-methyltransferase CheR [Brachyspira catarrhinii]TKZ35045.1 protein-glutamate O-methyltransferase CheR [Brachyspira catarrhinii]